MPAVALAQLCIVFAVPALLFAVFMIAWLLTAALWDVLLIGAASVVICWLLLRLYRFSGSRKPFYVVATVVAFAAVYAGYDTKALRDGFGINLAAPIYNVTGHAFGSYAERLREDFGNEFGRGKRCAAVIDGSLEATEPQREYCQYNFPNGVDRQLLSDFGETLQTGDLPSIQSALESFKRQPYFNYESVAPANWSSFGEWYRGDAAKRCEGLDPSDVNMVQALVFCFGNNQAFADRYCDLKRANVDKFELLRDMCGAKRHPRRAGPELEDLAHRESRLCSEGGCSGWNLPDSMRDRPLNWVNWLQKRAGWKLT